MDEDSIREDLWSVVQAFHRTWADEADALGLADALHPDLVASPFLDPLRPLDRTACVAAFRELWAGSAVLSWEPTEPEVHVHGFGSVGIVAYRFAVALERDGARWERAGRDLLVLLWDDSRWRIAAWHCALTDRG